MAASRCNGYVTYIEITRELLQAIPSQRSPQGSGKPFQDGGTFSQIALRDNNPVTA